MNPVIAFVLGLTTLALVVYAAVVAFRNGARSMAVMPYAMRWAALGVLPHIFSASFSLLLVTFAVFTAVSVAGTLLWLQLGYRPYPILWRYGPFQREEDVLGGESLAPLRRLNARGMAALCLACMGLAVSVYMIAGVELAPVSGSPFDDALAAPSAPADAPAPSGPADAPAPDGQTDARARGPHPVLIAFDLVGVAVREELFCRLLALAVLLALCRRWGVSPHGAILLLGLWSAAAQWTPGLSPGWAQPTVAFVTAVAMGYVMPLAGLEACVIVQIGVALCSPVLWLSVF